MGNGCSAYSMEGVQSDCVPEKIPLTQLGCVRGIYLYQKALELTCREVRSSPLMLKVYFLEFM